MAAVIALLLVGVLVAAVIFVASLFGAETTEGKGQAGTEQAAAQGPNGGSDGKDGASAKDSKTEDGKVKDSDGAKDGNSAKDGDSAKEEAGTGDADNADSDSAKDEGDEAQASEGQDEQSTASPSAEPTSQETEVSECGDADVAVEAATDQSAYQQGENPVLILSVTNESDDECTINLGTSEMEYLVTSGEDRVFSSADCQVEASDNEQTMKPGETEKAKLTWERNRTTPDCEPVEAEPQPGTYTLVAKLGERTSEEQTFTLK